MSKINFLALGGLDEKNNNIYILEIDSKIYIFDSGIHIPLNDDFGIKSFVPDIEYLLENRDKIKGIFLSSGKINQIGSLEQITNKIKDIKIYGSQLTLESVKIYFPKIDTKNLISIEPNKKIDLDKDNKLNAIEMYSSFPGTLGFVIETKDGNVFYFTDYIFNHITDYKIDFFSSNLNKYIGKNNLLLLSDSLNGDKKNLIFPDYKISNYIKQKDLNTENRIVSLFFEDELINFFEMLILSKNFNKKIFINDKNIFKIINKAFELGYFEEVPIHLYEKDSQIDENNSIVCFFGKRESLFQEVINLIENENEKNLIIKKEDLFLINGYIEPGNEHIFQDLESHLYKSDIKTVLKNVKLKKSLNPSQNDTKSVLQVLKPQYFLPIKGLYKNMFLLKEEITYSKDFDPNKIIIIFNGEKTEFNNGKYDGVVRKVKNGKMIIENQSNSFLDSKIIEERKNLAQDGIMTIFALIDKKENKLISKIDIQMKGVVYMKFQEKLLEEILKEIELTIKDSLETKNLNLFYKILNKNISKILNAKISKTPEIYINFKLI